MSRHGIEWGGRTCRTLRPDARQPISNIQHGISNVQGRQKADWPPATRYPTPDTRHSLGSFTLVELIMVMTIMLIMLGLAIGNMNEWGRASGLRGSVTRVRGGLNQARQRAITRREPTTFAYVSNVYLIREREVLVGQTNLLPRGFRFTNATPEQIEFLTDGRCNDTSTNWPPNAMTRRIVIRESDRPKPQSVTLMVYRTTGYIKVLNGEEP